MTELFIGQTAPDFSLPDSTGKQIRLSDFRGKKVVLYFYPKDDTSGCTTEACEFTSLWELFKRKGTVVIGISNDNTASHQIFASKYKITIPLLSDLDKSVVNGWGVYKEKSMYGKTYWGIERTTFLIDEQGRIARIWPKVTPQGHAKEVLEALG